MRIINIVGTRPNFMKIAPIIKELQKHSEIEHFLLHTGQHYDLKLSQNFFTELEIPDPDINLNIGSDTQAKQVAKIMIAFEEVCDKYNPDYILVVGDVNSTMACSLVAAKRQIKVIHVEAGIRSRDRNMPEEINRLVTDSIADYLLPPSADAVENLQREGHENSKIKMVGNVMIDTLRYFQDKIQRSDILEKLGLTTGQYVALTLHRPSNVDNEENLTNILKAIRYVSQSNKVVFPVHPRTKKMIGQFNLDSLLESEDIILTEPFGYFYFGKIISNSRFVLTDSGGIQEETTVYGIPCITIRENTERPVTISEGTNELAGASYDKITQMADRIMEGDWKKGKVPELWDGKTAERIVDFIKTLS
ncbi:MAG: UDP-N-acetylglucosamine 2-epimerase (non-hydrolyzing) [Cyclobacteriaceae bacterium]